MATLNEAREAIYKRFLDNWTGPSVTFSGEEFSPPVGSSWVRLAVRHRLRQQESLGGIGQRKFTSGGSVFIQCFVPLDQGERAADLLAQEARAIFEGVHMQPEGIRFNQAEVREIGPDDGWWQTNVEAVFQYTETK